jgi:hypothetical protein
MFGASEVIARIVWPQNEIDSCAIHTTPSAGDRYRASCSAKVKLAEGPWVENSYNECGYRSAASCAARRQGTIRIATVGTSFAEGFMVPYEQTFASLTEKELSRQCGRPVEIQNLSAPSLSPWQLAGRVEEALDLKPDVVAIILSANDAARESGSTAATQEGLTASSPSGRPSFRESIVEFLPFLLRHSRTLLMMRHFLYQDPEAYIRIYLRSHGEEADYLRLPYSPLWQRRMANTNELLARMTVKFHSRNIPVVLMPALFYPQVALLNSPQAIPGTDAHAFEQQLAAIAAKNGINFFPVVDDFAHLPHSEELFYTANGHMAAQGQTIYARSLVQQITEKRFLEPFGCTTSSTISASQLNKEK